MAGSCTYLNSLKFYPISVLVYFMKFIGRMPQKITARIFLIYKFSTQDQPDRRQDAFDTNSRSPPIVQVGRRAVSHGTTVPRMPPIEVVIMLNFFYYIMPSQINFSLLIRSLRSCAVHGLIIKITCCWPVRHKVSMHEVLNY